MCVYCVYVLCIYIYKDTHTYSIYFENVYMYVYIYINIIYILYKYI